MEQAVLEIDIAPFEVEHLSLPQTREDHHLEHRADVWTRCGQYSHRFRSVIRR
jgi:hypothetical protein